MSSYMSGHTAKVMPILSSVLVLIGFFLTLCVGINLGDIPWGLWHPRDVPSVDPSTLGQKTLYALASIKYCYNTLYSDSIPVSTTYHQNVQGLCVLGACNSSLPSSVLKRIVYLNAQPYISRPRSSEGGLQIWWLQNSQIFFAPPTRVGNGYRDYFGTWPK